MQPTNGAVLLQPDADKPRGWSMGLNGLSAAAANLTAVTLVCLMFYQLQSAALQMARDDRQMFRAELGRLHDDSQRKWESINANQRSLDEIADLVRADQKAVLELTAAVKTVAEEVKRIKATRPD